MRTIVVAVLLTLASIPVFATYTGLIAVPSTDVLPTGKLHLDIDSYLALNGDEGGSYIDYGLLYGLLPGVEVGVDVLSGLDQPVFANAKWQILSPQQSPVPLAIGLASAGNDVDPFFYGVGSYAFKGVRLTAGGYTGNDLGPDDSGIILGLDGCYGKWWLAADYFSGENAIGSWNVGVGYPIADNVGIIVGYDNYNLEGLPDYVNVQVDINLN